MEDNPLAHAPISHQPQWIRFRMKKLERMWNPKTHSIEKATAQFRQVLERIVVIALQKLLFVDNSPAISEIHKLDQLETEPWIVTKTQRTQRISWQQKFFLKSTDKLSKQPLAIITVASSFESGRDGGQILEFSLQMYNPLSGDMRWKEFYFGNSTWFVNWEEIKVEILGICNDADFLVEIMTIVGEGFKSKPFAIEQS